MEQTAATRHALCLLYQSLLWIFNGDYMVEQPDEDKPIWELLSLIHVYNPDTQSWDYVGDVPHDYYLGRSVKLERTSLSS